MKHTPGPWTLGRSGYNDNLQYRYVIQSPTRLVANAFGVADEPAEEAEANARLIAAAPELLAACLACLAREDIADDELGDVLRDAVGRAGVTIEGELTRDIAGRTG